MRESQGIMVLALGDSFTFGSACLAEEAFPYKVALHLGGCTINAGRPGYSLAQMLLIARDLIPEFRPKYVIVQYSDWLVFRSVRVFAESRWGRIPVPYFSDLPGYTLHLEDPVFSSKIFDLPVPEYVGTKASSSKFCPFFFRVGLPLLLHDDAHMLYYVARAAVGSVLEPTSRFADIVLAVYREILSLCESYGGEMIIVVLEDGSSFEKKFFVPLSLVPFADSIVDARTEMLKRLQVQTVQGYLEQYAHWGGEPLKVVDFHPNPHAHALIARCIIEKLTPKGDSSPH
jgi:hypothetical protein